MVSLYVITISFYLRFSLVFQRHDKSVYNIDPNFDIWNRTQFWIKYIVNLPKAETKLEGSFPPEVYFCPNGARIETITSFDFNALCKHVIS